MDLTKYEGLFVINMISVMLLLALTSCLMGKI
jgi:hypothetical protein